MKCQKCGNEFAVGIFCPKCGYKNVDDQSLASSGEDSITESVKQEISDEERALLEKKREIEEQEEQRRLQEKEREEERKRQEEKEIRELEKAKAKVEQERLAKERAEKEVELLKLQKEKDERKAEEERKNEEKRKAEAIRQAEAEKKAEAERIEREERLARTFNGVEYQTIEEARSASVAFEKEKEKIKVQKKIDAYAIWSLILGIATWPLTMIVIGEFLTIPAVVFGIIALKKKTTKKGCAIFGILSVVAYVATIAIGVIVSFN